MHRLPTLLFLLALLTIPAAVVFERAEGETWQSRLAFFTGKDGVNRHTPLYSEGTFLPPRLTQNTTLTADQNPIILSGRTSVEPGVTLTGEPGVNIVAHEFAELAIFGALRMQGTERDPILLTTNERHPMNQLWNGIIVEDGGLAEISHTKIEYASPGLTCLAGSRAEISNSEIMNTLVGVFRETPNCTVEATRIQAIRDSIVSQF